MRRVFRIPEKGRTRRAESERDGGGWGMGGREGKREESGLMRTLTGEGNSGDVKHHHQSLALKYSCLRVHLSTRAVVIQLRLPVIVVYSEDSIFESRSRVRQIPLKRVA